MKDPESLYPGGSLFAGYAAMAQPVLAFANERKFDFASPAEISSAKRAGGRQTGRTFWRQILLLSQCSALVALARHLRWHEACCELRRRPNCVPFLASLTGLTQSALELACRLGLVAPALASSHQSVRDALAGRDPHPAVMADLATILTDFLHIDAGEQKEVPSFPNPEIDAIAPALNALYTALESFQVPGPGSTAAFLQGQSSSSVAIRTDAGARQIDEFCRGHRQAITFAFMAGVTVPLVLLKTVNHFAMEDVHTPVVDELPLEDAPAWQTLKGMLER